MRYALAALAILVLSAIAGTVSGTYVRMEYERLVVAPIARIASLEKKTADLVFVGDIMLDRGVKGKVLRYGKGDFNFLFEQASFVKEADIAFANLEGPVSSRGANVGSIYSFRFDPKVMQVLKDAGFDVLSMANNHIGDWGMVALEDTLRHGNEAGLLMTGGGETPELARLPAVYEANGIEVGYLGFSDFGPPYIISEAGSAHAGVLSTMDPDIEEIIGTAARLCDILVVSFHFGDEYAPRSNARQQRLAHLAIDAGADIVAGHHPHVEQEVEEYNEGVIAYSLGNFIFDQNFSKETMRGMMLNVKVSETGIESYSTTTVYLNDNYQPHLD